MRFLDLAPHCSLPPRDGAERRAWHLYEGLINTGAHGRFIGRNVSSSDLTSTSIDVAGRRLLNGKAMSAIAAYLSRRDYWQFKMLTPEVDSAVAQSAKSFDTVLVHFLYSAALIKHFRGKRIRLLVDTHNYDPAVFEGFRQATRNPLTRALCRRAIRTSQRALAALPAGTELIHVSEGDAADYRRDRPELNHVVLENGGWATPRGSAPDYRGPGTRELLFVGSLSMQMNQDALRHFSKQFWPAVRDLARFTVVGSRPSCAVTELCLREGWQLCANVSDNDLNEKYTTAHFAVLPFSYGAGSKLKLLEACGRGVPVLATVAGITGIAPPPLVRVSDDPAEWRKVLEQSSGPTEADLQATHEFSQRFSWPTLATRLATIMQEARVITVP